jgi:transcriptional regulator with XRE-family HTH domain
MIDLKKFRKDKNIPQKEIQDLLGFSQPYVSALENGNKPINEEIFNKLLEKYNGDLLPYQYPIDENSNITKEPNSNKYKHNNSIGVPYYNIDVTCSITGSFSDIKELPDFYVDFKPFNDCTAYLPIYGDSMYPQFCSGEIIAISEWKNKEVILWGEPYLIITNSECNNLRTIKLIFPHDDPNFIILRASNPNFKGDTVVSKDCIMGLFIIKGKITRKQL